MLQGRPLREGLGKFFKSSVYRQRTSNKNSVTQALWWQWKRIWFSSPPLAEEAPLPQEENSGTNISNLTLFFNNATTSFMLLCFCFKFLFMTCAVHRMTADTFWAHVQGADGHHLWCGFHTKQHDPLGADRSLASFSLNFGSEPWKKPTVVLHPAHFQPSLSHHTFWWKLSWAVNQIGFKIKSTEC